MPTTTRTITTAPRRRALDILGTTVRYLFVLVVLMGVSASRVLYTDKVLRKGPLKSTPTVNAPYTFLSAVPAGVTSESMTSGNCVDGPRGSRLTRLRDRPVGISTKPYEDLNGAQRTAHLCS